MIEAIDIDYSAKELQYWTLLDGERQPIGRLTTESGLTPIEAAKRARIFSREVISATLTDAKPNQKPAMQVATAPKEDMGKAVGFLS